MKTADARWGRRMYRAVFVSVVMAVGLSAPSLAHPQTQSNDSQSSLNDGNVFSPQQKRSLKAAAKGRYIVILKEKATSTEGAATTPARVSRICQKHRLKSKPRRVYSHAIKGFTGEITDAELAALKRDPEVASVEEDGIAFIAAQTLPTGVNRMDVEKNATAKINGVDERVDVDVAILDTGVDLDHPDLNLVEAVNFTTYGLDDVYGHGTHVAGIVGALDNGYGVVGVAPGARIYSLKVMGDDAWGYWSDIIQGIDWVTAHVDTIEVVNMSIIGTGPYYPLQYAIQQSVAKGVVYVVAAGNDSQDIYGPDGELNTNDDQIPAAYPEVATISAMSPTQNIMASFSNFSRSVVAKNPVSSSGAAIDFAAPGVGILSTCIGGRYCTKSGTSMASPHGAGLAALYAAKHGRAHNAAGVYQIRQALIDLSESQSLWGVADTKDRDANKEGLADAEAVDPLNGKPLVSISASPTSGDVPLTVQFTSTASDSDGQIVGYKWTFGDGGTSSSPNPTHTYQKSGTYTAVLVVTDDGSATASAELTITVTELVVNQPPVLGLIGDQSIAEGNVLAFSINATDSEGDVLSYTASNLAAGSQFDPGTRTFSWTPGYDQAGSYPGVIFSVSDGEFSDTESVTITVTNTNRQPVITKDPTANPNPTLVNQAVDFSIEASDPDGDTLSYAWNFGDATTGTGNATSHTYSAVGTYAVTVTVTDSSGAKTQSSLQLGVSINQPPILQASAQPLEGTVPLTVMFSAQATDPEGESLTYLWDFGDGGISSDLTNPQHIYTDVGTYPARVDVADESGGKAAKTMTITALSAPTPNKAPVLSLIRNQTVGEGDLLRFTLQATDSDGDTLTYGASVLPSGASLNSATGEFRWAPTYDQAGIYAGVTFSVSDGELSDAKTITITVTDTNRPPIITADATASPNPALVNQAVDFSIAASDPDGDTLSYVWDFGDGTTGIGNATSHTYGSAGSYTASVKVSDGKSTAAIANTVAVTVKVLPVVNVIASDKTASEPGLDTGQFKIGLNAPAPEALTVRYALGGTAQAGADYVSLPGSVVIPAGVSSASIPVSVLDDALVEGRETVILSVVSDPAYQLSSASATVTLFDNEQPTLRIGASDSTASEPGSDGGQFQMMLFPTLPTPLTVRYVLGGTAQAGADYVTLPGSVVIPAGVSSASIPVSVLDDALVEGRETIILSVVSDPAYQVQTSGATITIHDDEQPTVSLVVVDPTASEPGMDTAQFKVVCLPAAASALTVSYTLSGKAQNGIDYALLPGSVVIPAGATSSPPILIMPKDDKLVEGTESVILTLRVGSSYQLGKVSQSINLLDND